MIQTEKKASIVYITLNRPEKRNALNDVMVSELTDVVEKYNQDKSCRVLVIKANGDAFSAGADLAYLTQLRQNTFEENRADSAKLGRLFKAIYTSTKITVSIVDGYALAGGCGLATICDYCFATPESVFGYTEVKIGFIPALVLVFLQEKIGYQRAKEITLSGEHITSEEAKTMGLIYKIVLKSNIYSEVDSFLEKLLCSTSAQAQETLKEMLNMLPTKGSLEDKLDYAAETNARARASKDCIKGMDAFLNKQKINWSHD